MRTTLTLDADVAARLDRLRATGRPFKLLVNDALRAGLDALEQPRERPRRSYTTPASLGTPALANMDDLSGVIAFGEGEGFR